ncbi:benzoylformate decarboxylase [Arthrobacter globiformis]|uniref:benzoylformate decarboxylase n=1 Tax=Arthrobacter globiformis TaxID=1665 RepID=UPI0027926E0C|nr:benzoylformate decarboxylase [Arthrobacter globiformis]MDQ0618428.1 benzoylformate decarboxylase [Arthrobacter globiformis]
MIYPTNQEMRLSVTRTIRAETMEILRQNNLTTVFGNPGSNELPFLQDFPEDFQYILGLHEGAVISMADGFAQASGNAAFVNLHAASGSGNAMGGLTNAVYSHSPLVITAGQQVRSMVGLEAMLANMDAPSLPRPLVKWSAEPLCAEDVPRTISQAVHISQLPAKGPVYVSIPYDDWDKTSPVEAHHLAGRTTVAAQALSADQAQELVDQLNAATNPVIVLGPEVDADYANDFAVTLADKLAAPVWIAPSASRCPFPTRHRSFRGVLPASIKDISEMLHDHDVVLVVGAPVFRYHQYVPGAYLKDGTRILHVTSDAGEAARAPMGDSYVASVRGTLQTLAEAVDQTTRKQLPELPDFAEPAASTFDAIHPESVFEELRTTAPADTVYVKESTSTSAAFWQQMDLQQQGSYFFPASGGLGFGLPATVGAQLAHKDRRVIGIIGDGSANYGITALWTAAQYNIPCIILILKNGTYGALRGFSRLLGTGETPGLDVPGLDFVQIASGYGVDAESVSTREALRAALLKALESQKPALIEIHTQFES